MTTLAENMHFYNTLKRVKEKRIVFLLVAVDYRAILIRSEDTP